MLLMIIQWVRAFFETFLRSFRWKGTNQMRPLGPGVIICNLLNSYRLPLPIGQVVLLTQPTRSAAHNNGAETALSDI